MYHRASVAVVVVVVAEYYHKVYQNNCIIYVNTESYHKVYHEFSGSRSSRSLRRSSSNINKKEGNDQVHNTSNRVRTQNNHKSRPDGQTSKDVRNYFVCHTLPLLPVDCRFVISIR